MEVTISKYAEKMSGPEKAASKKNRLSRREKRHADTSANSITMVRWFRHRKPFKRPRIWKDNEMDSQVEKDQSEEKEIAKAETAGDSKPPYKPEYQYSREELLKYSDSPLSRQKPVVTDADIENLYCWLKWNTYNKRSDTPTDRGDDSFKRRSNNDPRERVRKEQDGIVLSPQRRSFNSGCFVTVSQNPVTRPEPVKDGPPPPRRIGSGRIMNRDNWDFRDKENNEDGYYRTSLGPNRERDDRFDIRRNYSGISMDREVMRDVSRESLQRDKDLRSDVRAARDRDRMQRFSNDRRRFENEEPEWFSGGPTSQHDTIELRGFEDNHENGIRNKNKQGSKNLNKPNSKDSRSNTESRKSSSEEISLQKGNLKDSEPEPPVAHSSPRTNHRESPKNESDLPPAEDSNRTENHDFNFNLEDFLQLDNLPLLTNGGSGEGNQSSSRFSQWFRRDSPPDVNDTRRSSIQDEIIKNIINDINEPSINIPNMKESDAYFAPISPAGTTSGNSLLEMLQGNHQQNDHRGKPPSIKDLEATGKLTSLEELEARMRQGAGQSPVSHPQNQHKKGVSSSKKEEELIAFKKLLKQVSEGGVTPASLFREQAVRSPALSQMLNKPPEPSDMMGQAHQPNAAASMHVPQDLVYKLLHVQEQQRQVQQQQEINKLLFQSGRLAPPQVHGALSPLPPELQVLVANSQPSPELLNRPEAQAILQGLRQGEITPQHLVQQLQNQAMQPRHREVLASILKLHGGSPRPASPLMVPPDPALIQQLMLQQQLRIPSPLPPMPNGLPHRVPSPRELMLHTQTIMQSALIKKKLEEQRENYRKRQELQRATSPNVAAGAKSPNPTANATSNANNNANNNPASTPSTNNNNNNNNNNTSSIATGTSATTTMAAAAAAAANAAGNSNTSATKSPTPLAFTPTSVLRKMTAEQQPQPKDGDGNKNKYNELLKLQRQNELLKLQAAQVAQSSRFLANNQLLNMRSPQQQWSMPKQTMQQPMQQGRAIVKGSGNFAPAPPPGPGLVDLPYGNNARPVYPQRSKLTMAATPLVQPNLYNSFPSSANRGPPNRGFAPQMGPLAQHNVNMNPALQQLLMSQNMTSAQQRNVYKQPDIRNSFHQFLPGNGGDGDLSTSPTASNQLAHWFTPELLAQAQAQTRSGKADSTLNMVSVEELERHQQNSAPVLN